MGTIFCKAFAYTYTSASAKAMQHLSPSQKTFSYSKTISYIINSKNLVKSLSGHAGKLYDFFQDDQSVIWQDKKLSNHSGHTENPFAGHMWSAKGFAA